MLTENFTYEDFEGNQVTETLHFNITKAELMQAEAEYEGTLSQKFLALAESKNPAEIMAGYRIILRLAYGKRSEDGRHFRKSDEIWEDFVSSAAFDPFIFSLMTDGDKASRFVDELLPKDLRSEYQKGLQGMQNPNMPQDFLQAQQAPSASQQVTNEPAQPYVAAQDPRSAWLEQQRMNQAAQQQPNNYPQQ